MSKTERRGSSARKREGLEVLDSGNAFLSIAVGTA